MKNILPPQSLIKYQPSVEIYQSMKAYHQEDNHNSQNQLNVSAKVQQIIDAILPPRDWTDHHNKLHIQYVSHQPSSRQDVEELTQTLDKMLYQRQAKKTGICPIRQELYRQAFDELIRQVAVDCPQRGLLLMRVRDEHMMTLAAYQTIYQSSIAYSIRKGIQSQQGCDKIQEEYQQLLKQKEEFQEKKSLLLGKKDMVQKEIRQNRSLEVQKKEDQLKFLKLQKQNMSKFLQAVKTQFRMAF